MLSVPVYSMSGKKTGEQQIDPAVLGDRVRHQLIKQAVVAFLNHQRQDSARTKSRSQVEGSTRKLYRQKGTGNARAGNIRTPIRRGGGHTFAKAGSMRVLGLPKGMRRLARNSAILAKIRADQVAIIEDLSFPEAKTKSFAAMLEAVDAGGGCLLALHEHDKNVYLSGRNIPRTDIRRVEELNAYEVMRRRKVIFTRDAFARLSADPVGLQGEDNGGNAG